MENLNPINNIESAKNEIEAIRQEIYMMGANDYEIPAIDKLIERLERNECSPEEALKKALTIKGGKADYH
jgi:hypothetical protein